jgi:molybdopterin converting factor small subunit
MNITVRYEAQVRRAAGAPSQSLDVRDRATVRELIRRAAEKADEALRRLLLDEAGEIRSTVMVFVGDEHVPLTSRRPLVEGETVTITSPISGG